MSNAVKATELEESAWETGALGESEINAHPAPEALEASIDDALELQMISIRLPRETVDGFKFIASREGMRYQTLMKQILHRFVVSEVGKIARQMASEVKQKDADNLHPQRKHG